MSIHWEYIYFLTNIISFIAFFFKQNFVSDPKFKEISGIFGCYEIPFYAKLGTREISSRA
jgi:hypothetical protein